MIIIGRNDIHLGLGAHISNAVHVNCIFVLIINQIVVVAGTSVNEFMFYHFTFLIIDICH